ncbi:MAG: 30S ribosomal protein S20 [Phycisphaerae bacterium]
MPHSASAKKRLRQNQKRRLMNRARKSQLKTEIRKFMQALERAEPEAARQQFRRVVKKLDQIAAKGTIHPNAAARKKARLAKRLNDLPAVTAGR